MIGKEVRQRSAVGETDLLLMGNLIEWLFGVIEGVFRTLLKGIARIIFQIVKREDFCLRKRMMFADEHMNQRIKERREDDVCISKGFVEHT